jgi:hypothetical protein
MLPKRQQLEDRLRDLTHQADIMVFMKGAPQVSAYLSAVIRIRDEQPGTYFLELRIHFWG